MTIPDATKHDTAARPLIVRKARVVTGTTLEDTVEGDLLVQGGRIRQIGRVDLQTDASELDAEGGYVLPGLIDAHVHLGLVASLRPYAYWDTPASQRGLALYRNGLIGLVNGITSVRDLGAADYSVVEYGRLVEGDQVIGPRVVAAGRLIAMTGGHGWEWGRQADGPDDVRRAVREQIRGGAKVIKLMATGGLSTPGSPYSAELTVHELRAGVEEAHKAGLQAAAHAHNSAGVTASLEAGIDSIEHAALVEDAELIEMARRGTILVPTLTAIADVRAGAGLDPDVVAKTEAARPIFFERIRTAIAAGVEVAAGTDAGTALNPIGRVVAEIEEYHRLGADVLRALRAATVVAGRLIGKDVGVIQPGAVADMIITPDDPRDDLAALRRLRWVVARGRVVDLAWARQTIASLPGV